MTTLVQQSRHRSTVAFVPVLAATAMFLVGIRLSLTGVDGIEVEDIVDGAMLLLFPLVGAGLLARARSERIGRLFCAIGLATGFGYLAGGWSAHDWPGRSLAGVLATATFVGSIVVLLNFLPLLFPDGRLPSPRWRPVALAAAASGTLAVLSVLLMPGVVDEDDPRLGVNPLGVPALEPVLEIVEVATLVGLGIFALLGVASLVMRWRRSTGPVRRQVTTLGAGLVVLIGLFLLDGTLQAVGGSTYGVVAAIVAIGAVPAASAIALLRD